MGPPTLNLDFKWWCKGNLVCLVGARVPGTLIDEWRRALVVGHLYARDSMKGTLREGSFTGEPERWGFWEMCKMPCKRASLIIRALLGSLEGVCLSWLLREKKSVVEERKTNLMSLAILFHFLCAQHVSDVNISIIRSLRLCWWCPKHVEHIRSEIK